MVKLVDLEITPKIVQQIYDLMHDWRMYPNNSTVRNAKKVVHPTSQREIAFTPELDDARRAIDALRVKDNMLPAHIDQLYKIKLGARKDFLNEMSTSLFAYDYCDCEKITWVELDNLLKFYNRYRYEEGK